MCARGAQKASEDMSKSGYNSAQQFNTNLESSNSALQNYLLPQYKNMIQNPGYDQATKNAITQNSEGAGMDKLAQDKAGTMASTAAGNQIQFANRAKQDVQEGTAGLSGLYGMDTNLLSKSLGIPAEYLQQYNNAANQRPSPLWGTLSSLISAGGAVGAAALK